ncbi:MAG: CoA-binding domain protein [Microbacteriaceae bacterium]|nr:CoA-binding domain protein [Microbacteriaceae bacterium]MCW3000633.1 CoA-binding domain protein [Solirubrobacterales bacterium]
MRAPVPAISVREMHPGDEAAVGRLLAGLDPESSYLRWFTGAVDLGVATDWAAHPDRVDAIGLLALAGDETVGHGVLIPCGDGRAEMAFEVAAPWRRHGVAGALLEHLLDAGERRGLREIFADVLCENGDMLAVLRERGVHRETRDGGVVTITFAVPPVRAGTER